MKKTARIEDYMTPVPHTIGHDIPVKKAIEIMHEFKIRHLPVQDAGKLVGVLSDRDLKLVTSFGADKDLKVEEVMIPDPYAVEPGSELSRVVREMAKHKYGCAIVQKGAGRATGIFTANDALRILGDLLEEDQ